MVTAGVLYGPYVSRVSIPVTHQQAVAYRLHVHHLTTRLPAHSYAEAARYAVQDSAPRSALVSLHARVEDCEPSAWEGPALLQTYSPRAAVHVLPRQDFGVFTVGRLPGDPDERRALETEADQVCRALAGRELRSRELHGELRLRWACGSGRIAVRWTTTSLSVREVPAPDVDLDAARRELCRRHVHAFGPTTPEAFAWWAGLTVPDARATWRLLTRDLREVALEGQRAWILAEDLDALRSVPAARGVRLLPAEELRLFGHDRSGLFVGPGRGPERPGFDTFHPHGLVVDGAVVGMWGRRGGRVDLRVGGALAPRVRRELEAEVAALPIPGATMRLACAEGWSSR